MNASSDTTLNAKYINRTASNFLDLVNSKQSTRLFDGSQVWLSQTQQEWPPKHIKRHHEARTQTITGTIGRIRGTRTEYEYATIFAAI
jgi:hypothetical protein